jgi:hypothetical protein
VDDEDDVLDEIEETTELEAGVDDATLEEVEELEEATE